MSSNFQYQSDPNLQKRVSGQVFSGGTTTSVAASQSETIVKSDEKVLISHEQHIASELPVTQQRIVTQEFIPVMHEKIITTVPIVTEEKVTTGHSIAGGKQTSAMGQAYMQGTRAEVELETHLTTGIPMYSQQQQLQQQQLQQQQLQQQQTRIAQVPVTTAHVEKEIIPVEVERVRYDTTTVPVQVTNQTYSTTTTPYVTGTTTQNVGYTGGYTSGTSGLTGGISERTSQETYSSSGYDQTKMGIQQSASNVATDIKNVLNPNPSQQHHHLPGKF